MPPLAPKPLLRLAMGLLFCLRAGAAGSQTFDRVALQALRARGGGGVLRVLHFGDSHTGSQRMQLMIQGTLQAQFGAGGAGLALPWTRRGRAWGSSGAWRRLGASGTRVQDYGLGLGGTALEGGRKGERLWLEDRFDRLRLHLLRQPGGGSLRVRVDGRDLGVQELDAPQPEALVLDREMPRPGRSHRLELEILRGGPCRVLGLALEQRAGVTYSALSVNGAHAAWLLRMPGRVLETQLAAEAPDLVILAFGTNEASGRDFDAEGYPRLLRQVIERVRQAAPLAALMLVAPPDAAFRSASPANLDRISQVQREQAQACGAAFVDLRAEMGGAGSIHRWQAQGLAQGDLIHFTPEGYARHAWALLGTLFRRLEATRNSPTLMVEFRRDGRLALLAEELFQRPDAPPGLPPAPRAVSPSRIPEAPGAPIGNTIYTFRTRDGRTIITDNPSSLEGLEGVWLGAKPGRKK